MNSSNRNKEIVFGDFHLYPCDGRLRRDTDGYCVTLTPTLLEILLVLVEDPGNVIAKDQFLARVWPGRVVEEGNLSRNVSSLRKLLEDNPQNPRYIQTAAGRGYRFIANVRDAKPSSADQKPSGTAASRKPLFVFSTATAFCLMLAAVVFAVTQSRHTEPQVRSLVVLPIQDLSADSERWFADGMTEEMIATLSTIAELDVASRTSSMRYLDTGKSIPTIAEELGVKGVVEGSVMRTGETVRLSVRLIDGVSDRVLWAANFERNLADAFLMHGEIATQLASKLNIELPEAQITGFAAAMPIDSRAQEAYLIGRHFKNKRTVESLHQALDYFDAAIQVEPSFYQAHAAKADTFMNLASWQGPSRLLWPKARSAADTALALKSNEAEALLVRAGALLCHDLDAAAAEPVFLRALEQNPSNPLALHRYAYSLMTQGRFEEGIAWARRALRLDPASPQLNHSLGRQFHYAGRYTEARKQLEYARNLDPSYPATHRILGHTYLQTGQIGQAVEALQTANALGGGPGLVGELGYAYAIAGQENKALEQLNILQAIARQGKDAAYGIALVYHGLGDADQALAWLERAYGERDFRMIYLRIEPIWDGLRSDPRFSAFLQRVGLNPAKPQHI